MSTYELQFIRIVHTVWANKDYHIMWYFTNICEIAYHVGLTDLYSSYDYEVALFFITSYLHKVLRLELVFPATSAAWIWKTNRENTKAP